MLTPAYLPTNQSGECPRADHAPLNHCYKTPHYPLQVGTHSFEGISLPWPCLLGKAVKLFFSTSPKTLSLRLDLIQCRGTEAGFDISSITPLMNYLIFPPVGSLERETQISAVDHHCLCLGHVLLCANSEVTGQHMD